MWDQVVKAFEKVKSLSEFCWCWGHTVDHSHKSVPSSDCAVVAKLLEETKQLTKKEIKYLKQYSFPFVHLALSGGSANGISYIGAYKALYEIGIIKHITEIAGTSTGSIAALYYALKVDPDSIINEVVPLNVNEFLDSSNCCCIDIFRLIWKFGYYKGDFLESWVDNLLFKHTGKKQITFSELYKITKVDLKITVYNHSFQKLELWNHVNEPDTPVSVAVRCSTCLPWLYVPKTLNDTIYIDGGVESYLPLDAVDKTPLDKTTLGLILSDKENQPPKQKDNNIIDHFVDLYMSFSSASFASAHKTDDWKGRSISIPNPGKRVYDFNFTEEAKLYNIALAYEGVLQNLKYYTRHHHFPRKNLKHILK